MRELLLVRYGEVFLKGQNRPYFMRKLVDTWMDLNKNQAGNGLVSYYSAIRTIMPVVKAFSPYASCSFSALLFVIMIFTYV